MGNDMEVWGSWCVWWMGCGLVCLNIGCEDGNYLEVRLIRWVGERWWKILFYRCLDINYVVKIIIIKCRII